MGHPVQFGGLLAAPFPAPSVPGGRGHPAKVGGYSRTQWPGEGGATLRLGGCPGLALARPGPPLPPRRPGLHSPRRDRSRRPSERPSPRPAPAAQGCAPAPPTERKPHPRLVIGRPGPYKEPIGCEACSSLGHAPPRARAFLRGHVAARGGGGGPSPTPRLAAHAWAGGAQPGAPAASLPRRRSGRGRRVGRPRSIRPVPRRSGPAAGPSRPLRGQPPAAPRVRGARTRTVSRFGAAFESAPPSGSARVPGASAASISPESTASRS